MAGIDAAKQVIRDRLKDGPVWTRSFQRVKPLLDRMIADGEVIRCKPYGGKANNMVCLAPKAPARMSMLDWFAERLSIHGDVAKAAEEVGQTPQWGRFRFAEIRRALGPQAH